MSNDVRKSIFQKQVLYFIVLNIMEFPNTVVIYIRWKMIKDGIGLTPPWLKAQAWFYGWFVARGTVLSLLRLIEPSFRNQLKEFCMDCISCFKCRSNKASMVTRSTIQSGTTALMEREADDPNIAFLSSSLNNMLVCGVLKGINLSLNNFNFDLKNINDKKEI